MKYEKSYTSIIVGVAAVAILVAWFAFDPSIFLSRATTIPEPRTDTGIATTNTTALDKAQGRVAVGGGNLTLSLNKFLPSTIDIQPGKNVTFYAPSRSTEVHNVIVDLSNGTAISDVEVPFILPQGVSPEALQLAPPNNIGEPVTQNMSDGRQTIIALNKVVFHPSTVNQNGNVTYLQEPEFMQQIEQARQQGLYMPVLSANYTMQGTERIVSSGLIVDLANVELPVQSTSNNSTNPQGEPSLPAYPVLSKFTVTFEKPGTYPFFCAFHPGMVGVVNVTQ
jgi:plastocyanin